MPWNNQGNGGNDGPSGGPWGGSPGNNSNRPQGGRPSDHKGSSDFDDMFQRGQDRLRKFMQGGSRHNNLIGVVILAIVAIWLLSGFYRVQQDEQGIQLVFGKANPSPVGPGLHYNWPTPIGSVVLSRTGSENRIEVGFNSGRDPHHSGLPPESLMLTGDENIIDIKFVVLWKINDPFKYEFNIRDQEHTITRAAESAIREVIGETPIQTALTEGREEVSTKTRAVLQKMLDEYSAGVTVNGIELQAVSPPEKVVDAFSDVQRARSDSERARNEAEAYRNSILPRAQGEAARKRQGAIGYAAEVVNRATGDAARFKSILQSYEQSKEITARRLYIETLEDVFTNSRKVVIDSAVSGSIVLPYLPMPNLPASDSAVAPTGGQK